jgi:flavin-binding protein dodecin
MLDFGKYIDLFGVSVDSFDERVNVAIGRSSATASLSHVDSVLRLAVRPP